MASTTMPLHLQILAQYGREEHNLSILDFDGHSRLTLFSQST